MRRTLLAITAVLLATIGTTLLYVYVSTADNRAKAQVERVSVYVAKIAVPPGTPFSVAQVDRRPVDRMDLVDGAMTDVSAIQGQVLKVQLVPGQQITKDMFSPEAQGPLAKGHRAVSVQFGEAERVASLIKAGSKVDVWQLGTGQPKPVLTAATVLSVQQNGIVTFDLDPRDASTLLAAMTGGRLVLTINAD